MRQLKNIVGKHEILVWFQNTTLVAKPLVDDGKYIEMVLNPGYYYTVLAQGCLYLCWTLFLSSRFRKQILRCFGGKVRKMEESFNFERKRGC